jgi:Co/Zn/Cd efflux system component
MYAEWLKNKYGHLNAHKRFVLEVYIPSFSVLALLAVTAYVLSDAINVIRNKGRDDGEDVNVVFLFAFSTGNFMVDVLSSLMFYLRGSDGFKHYAQVLFLNDDSSAHHSGTSEEHEQQQQSDQLAVKEPGLRHYSIDERTERLIIESEEALHSYQQQKQHDKHRPHSPRAQRLASPRTDNHKEDGKNPIGSAVRKIRHNLNMLSAFTHVGSDTLRTVSVFIAALVATFSGYSGNLCDAWAAVVVSITICFAVIPLLSEIFSAATHPLDDVGREIVRVSAAPTLSTPLSSSSAGVISDSMLDNAHFISDNHV